MFEKLKELVEQYKPNVSLAQRNGSVVGVASLLLGSLVEAANAYAIPGVDKKAAVLAAFGEFYDSAISNLPLPWLPSVVSRKVFALLRPVAMQIASEAIEYAVSLLKKDAE
jgi:hypothetical protein